jgi:hypothetical protein
MEGLQEIILESGGITSAFVPVAVLLAFTALFTAVAASRFRFEDAKVYFG